MSLRNVETSSVSFSGSFMLSPFMPSRELRDDNEDGGW